MSTPPDQTPNQPDSGSIPPGSDPFKLPPFLQGPEGPNIPSSKEDRTFAMIIHLTGITCTFILPLILWLIKKDKSEFINDQGKEALNFNISAFVVAFVLAIIAGIIHLAILSQLFWLVIVALSVIAGMKANAGIAYRHKYTFRLIK